MEGSLRTRKWQDKEGNDRYTTEIRGDRMQMLGGRGGAAPGNAPPDTGAADYAQASGKAPRPARPAQAPIEVDDQDIPF